MQQLSSWYSGVLKKAWRSARLGNSSANRPPLLKNASWTTVALAPRVATSK